MEKAQVTIALQASEITGPLGQHAVSAFVVTDALGTEVVFISHDLGEDREIARFCYPAGAFMAHDADVLAVNLGNALYDYILRYKGIQPELPVASGP